MLKIKQFIIFLGIHFVKFMQDFIGRLKKENLSKKRSKFKNRETDNKYINFYRSKLIYRFDIILIKMLIQ